MQRGVYTVGLDNGGTYQITQMLTGDIFAGYFRRPQRHIQYRQPPPRPLFHGRSLYNMPFNLAIPVSWSLIVSFCTYADENSVDRAMATVVRVFGMHRITTSTVDYLL